MVRWSDDLRVFSLAVWNKQELSVCVLKLERPRLNTSTDSRSKEWKQWKKTLENYLSTFLEREGTEQSTDKLKTSPNCTSYDVYAHIEDCATYHVAIDILQRLYVKTPNSKFARLLLATTIQQPEESLVDFLKRFHCNFRSINAEECRQKVRDSFING